MAVGGTLAEVAYDVLGLAALGLMFGSTIPAAVLVGIGVLAVVGSLAGSAAILYGVGKIFGM